MATEQKNNVMSQSWINRLLRRDRKRTRNLHLKTRRRLTLEGLETRKLLAHDLMNMAGDAHVVMMAGHDDAPCTSHADSPVKATEHCAALALANPAEATHSVMTSGNSSD